MQVIFRPEARRDIEESHHWYEQIEPALADSFLDALESAVTSIQLNPEAYPMVHRKIRRVLLRRFPYGLFYQVEPERVVVLAIFHQARDPRSVARRV